MTDTEHYYHMREKKNFPGAVLLKRYDIVRFSLYQGIRHRKGCIHFFYKNQ